MDSAIGQPVASFINLLKETFSDFWCCVEGHRKVVTSLLPSNAPVMIITGLLSDAQWPWCCHQEYVSTMVRLSKGLTDFYSVVIMLLVAVYLSDLLFIHALSCLRWCRCEQQEKMKFFPLFSGKRQKEFKKISTVWKKKLNLKNIYIFLFLENGGEK